MNDGKKEAGSRAAPAAATLLLLAGFFAFTCVALKDDGDEGMSCIFDGGGCRKGLYCTDAGYCEKIVVPDAGPDAGDAGPEDAGFDAGPDGGSTWIDQASGLMWQNLASPEVTAWFDADEYCATLLLDDFTGWRLPALNELRGLIRGCTLTQTGGTCGVNDLCLDLSCYSADCGGCAGREGPGEDGCYRPEKLRGGCRWYWTMTPVTDYTGSVWGVNFLQGSITANGKDSPNAVMCVRKAE